MSGSFTQKELRLTFNLSNGSTFTGAGGAGPTLQLTQLRASATITGSGSPAWPTLELVVWGMTQQNMNALSALTLQVTGISRNTVQVEANTGPNGQWSTVFAGQIVFAEVNYDTQGEASLLVHGQYLYYDALNPAAPLSYTGSTPIATVVGNLAANLGAFFENNGVNGNLGTPYYAGTDVQKLRKVVSDAGVDLYIEPGIGQSNADQNNPTAGVTIAICPKGTVRKGIPSFNLSKGSGLVGYPKPDSRGYLNVKALYNPAFRFGGPLQISGSDVVIDGTQKKNAAGQINGTLLNAQANGNWMIAQLHHVLEARKYDGEWFSYMLLFPPGTEPPQQ